MTCTMYSCQAMGKNLSAGPDGGDRPRLSKRTVTERALKLADADGLDTLTIRKLAQHLGVTPMAFTGISAARKICSRAWRSRSGARST